MKRAIYKDGVISYEESPVRPDKKPLAEVTPTVWDELDAAYQEGVNKAYEQ
ncbi:MAG: hypothetical protein IJ396_07715 [Oscillibacter sp.]|nr:hypothetical protein [Oscillibacter sp.]MBQ7778783.1 hypothetical protein [Oscillibacter sp.]